MTVVGLIAGAMRERDIKATKIAPALHMSQRTFYYRMKSPDEFTIAELKAASRVLKIPMQDILAAALEVHP